MDNENEKDEPKVQAENNSIAIGGMSIGGNVGDIRIGHITGYTAEEVSVLIAQIKSTFQPKPFDGRCPYKGLDVFEEEDAELFFGREKLVDDLMGRVKDSRTLFVTGPSGSGKSSLVRAGLIHALKQGAIKSSERWLYETMKPGRDPIGELGRVASSLASSTNAEDEIRAKAISDSTIFARWCEIALKDGRDKRVVLFIDQFEEVFTQINKEEERVAFLNLLTHAATVEGGRVILLFSMRSDFVSNCATYPQLNSLLNQQFIQIGAMQPDELVSAMAQPALRVGLRIDPDLIAQVINDMKGEPGALPLMQFTLKDLFDAQQVKGGLIALTLNDYLQHGGIQKSLERHADAAFAKLEPNEQKLARSIFSGLIEIGRGTQDTRRTALFDELIPANTRAEDLEAIVRKLADARLITTDEQAGKDTVTISHEKLIDAWPWLKKLVNENRDVIALQNEIASDAKEWSEHKRDASYLYSGVRLINANEQLKSNKLVLSGTAFEYIRVGQARQQQSRLILIGTLSTVFALLILAVIVFSNQSSENALQARENQQLARQNSEIANTAQAASTLAVAQAEEAQKQKNIALSRQLAVQSGTNLDSQYDLALLLSAEAKRNADTEEARASQLRALLFNEPLQTYLFAHSAPVTRVAFSSDNRILASADETGTLILWDRENHSILHQIITKHHAPILRLAFSPNGKLLISISYGNRHIVVDRPGAEVFLWDVTTGNSLKQVAMSAAEDFTKATVSNDAKVVAFVNKKDEVIFWDVMKETYISRTASLGNEPSLALDRNGKELTWVAPITTDRGNIIELGAPTLGRWSVGNDTGNSPLLITGHSNLVDSITLSSNSALVATASYDGRVVLYKVGSTTPIAGFRNSNWPGAIEERGMAFNQSGDLFAFGDGEGAITIYDVNSNQTWSEKLRGHSGNVLSLAFADDLNMFASGGQDGKVILWELDRKRLEQEFDKAQSITYNQAGDTIAVLSDNNLSLYDSNSRSVLGRPFLVTASNRIWEFFPDAQRIVASDYPGGETVFVWDIQTGRLDGEPIPHPTSRINEVNLSPDGKLLATTSSRGDAWIFLRELPSRKLIVLKYGSTAFTSIDFSPDSSLLASGTSDGKILLWDMPTYTPKVPPWTGHSDWVSSVAFSPNGKYLASGGADRVVKIWNSKTGQPFGAPLVGHTALIRGLAFSSDG
ncbi:MAG: hypothetical protein L0Z71_05035, partial [Anaerolineae bacterium]|nr:hypothetical protein [Anaerolineae bacterium]